MSAARRMKPVSSKSINIRALTEKLYRRARREQAKYVRELKEQKPEDILHFAAEYVLREAILQELGYVFDNKYRIPAAISIPPDELTALLRSKTPLQDICYEVFSDTALYGEGDFRKYLQTAIHNCGGDLLRQEFLERKRRGDFSHQSDRRIFKDEVFNEIYMDDGWED